MISADLAPFLESGISILVGTRDARLRPDAVRAVGARVEHGGEELTLLLPDATAAGCLADLRDNGRIAACFSRARDHRSIQVKGRVTRAAPADAADREVVERYRAAVAQEWGFVGLPPRITFRVAHWPCHAVRLRVEAVFVQTPGPGAGAPLGGAS